MKHLRILAVSGAILLSTGIVLANTKTDMVIFKNDCEIEKLEAKTPKKKDLNLQKK